MNDTKVTRSLSQAVASAAKTQAKSAIPDRFDKASQLLSVQPTGFSEPVALNQANADIEPVSKTDDKGRKIYFAKLSIDLIDPNPFNARKVYLPEKINQMATSMLASGQLVPGLGTMRDGRCICVAGNYRHKGLRKAGMATMDIMIHEGLTDRELYEYSFKENDERSDQSALDNALVWRNLIDDGLYANETAISEALGVSLSHVNKTLSILKLPATVIEIIREAPSSYVLWVLHELYMLSKVADLKLVEELCRKIGAGEAGRKECEELRAKFENPKPRKAKETSRQYKIHSGGAEVGVLKDWDSGKVAFEIRISDTTEREALVKELKERFKLAD